MNKKLINNLLNTPTFLKRISIPVSVNYSFDIPDLVGYSQDSRIIFIDKHLRRSLKYKGREIDITNFLVVQGVIEKSLKDIYGFNIISAKHIAAYVVNELLLKNSIDLKTYYRFIFSQRKNKNQVQIIPANLDNSIIKTISRLNQDLINIDSYKMNNLEDSTIDFVTLSDTEPYSEFAPYA